MTLLRYCNHNNVNNTAGIGCYVRKQNIGVAIFSLKWQFTFFFFFIIFHSINFQLTVSGHCVNCLPFVMNVTKQTEFTAAHFRWFFFYQLTYSENPFIALICAVTKSLYHLKEQKNCKKLIWKYPLRLWLWNRKKKKNYRLCLIAANVVCLCSSWCRLIISFHFSFSLLRM